MTPTIWAQAIVEHGALSGAAASFASAFDRVQANFEEHQTMWLVLGAVLLLILWRRR